MNTQTIIVNLFEKKIQDPIIYVGDLSDKRNFTHVSDIVKAYWLAINKCKPGELNLIGNENKDNIFTFKQALDKLIKLSRIKNIKIKLYKPFIRPTNVPRLIIGSRKFQNKTKWKPIIDFDTILLDTLEYWRNEIKKGSINLY